MPSLDSKKDKILLDFCDVKSSPRVVAIDSRRTVICLGGDTFLLRTVVEESGTRGGTVCNCAFMRGDVERRRLDLPTARLTGEIERLLR